LSSFEIQGNFKDSSNSSWESKAMPNGRPKYKLILQITLICMNLLLTFFHDLENCNTLANLTLYKLFAKMLTLQW
jgi:hypothetical protein